MTYLPPSGASVSFSTRTGYVVPSGANVWFSWSPCGDGAVSVLLSAASVGVTGVQGRGEFSDTVVGSGVAYLHPTGVGEARFSMDALASAVGHGAAQVRFNKAAAGIVGAFGSAQADSFIRASASGWGDAVRATCVASIPFSSAGAGTVNEVLPEISGAAQAVVAITLSATGDVRPVASGKAALRITGAATGKVGRAGVGDVVIPIQASGTARRGSVGVGRASLGLRSTGMICSGVGGTAAMRLDVLASGQGTFVTPIIINGSVCIPIIGRGYGERVLTSIDGDLDRVFARTLPKTVFVMDVGHGV